MSIKNNYKVIKNSQPPTYGPIRKVKQLFCSHQHCMLIKHTRNGVRLPVTKQYWECQDCFKILPFALASKLPRPRKVKKSSSKGPILLDKRKIG